MRTKSREYVGPEARPEASHHCHAAPLQVLLFPRLCPGFPPPRFTPSAIDGPVHPQRSSLSGPEALAANVRRASGVLSQGASFASHRPKNGEQRRGWVCGGPWNGPEQTWKEVTFSWEEDLGLNWVRRLVDLAFPFEFYNPFCTSVRCFSYCFDIGAFIKARRPNVDTSGLDMEHGGPKVISRTVHSRSKHLCFAPFSESGRTLKPFESKTTGL